jgi:hypothetical protein
MINSAELDAHNLPKTIGPIGSRVPTSQTNPRYRRSCEGFRMTAHRDDAAGAGADVRKPPGKEAAGRGARTLPRGYGDLIAAMGLSARREGVRLG